MHDNYTTAEAAKLCGVSTMTIIRCFDSGKIKGFRVPGSRFRRIPKESLVEFARANGITLTETADGALPAVPDARARRAALVVEDDEHFAQLLEKVLEADGWDVQVARNGFDAGLLAGKLRPELVILDILLPQLDGREVCRRLRADPLFASTKIIAVTALKDAQSLAGIQAAGVDACLHKPIKLSALREQIAALTAPTAKASAAAGGQDALCTH